VRRSASLIAGLAALLLSGCSVLVPTPSPVLETPLPNFATTIQTPEGTVGVVKGDGSLRLIFVNGGGGGGSFPQGDAPHVYLLSFGGETGSLYNSYVYGLAPSSAATFEVAGATDAIGGQVVNGAFVVALKAKDVQPGDLHWTFRAVDGSILLTGANITP
jgi:hypothetical protein